MQAFEWTKLISEGVRPWGNPWGAEQFGAIVLHDHRLPRHPRDDRRDLPAHHRAQGLARRLRHRPPGCFTAAGDYENVEITGLYWHFVDLVWVFIFAFFYLW